MNGENEIDWACGFYDEFHQALYDGEVTFEDAKKLYKEHKITQFQFEFAKNYLTLIDD